MAIQKRRVPFSWLRHPVDHVRTHVSKDCVASIIRVKMLVLTRATWRHIPEDSILHTHRCKNFKSDMQYESSSKSWHTSEFLLNSEIQISFSQHKSIEKYFNTICRSSSDKYFMHYINGDRL
jgi:hypothetical protein